MNRLTIINEILEEINFEVPSDREGAYSILDIAAYSCEEEKKNILLNIAEKLAAYEDSGLEPEELQEYLKRHDFKELHDHISELLDLEEQGRLIKLPCRIGGDLYMVSHRVDGKGHVRRLTLTHNNLGNILRRLGNDVFLAREEAEQALEGAKDE